MVMSPRSVAITALVRVFSLSGAMSWTLSLAMMVSCDENCALGNGLSPPCRPDSAPDQRGKFRDQLVVQLALEWHDQAGDFLEIGPAPGRELGLLGRDVDVAVGAEEAECEPFLALAAEPALPDLRHQLGRQIVLQPILALADEARAVGADLLAHLAPGGLQRLLALVDAALRHLPGRAGVVDALGHEHLALLVDQHDADARPVGQLGDLLCGHWYALGRVRMLH